MNVVASIRSCEGAAPPLALPQQKLNPVGEFQMINVGDFRMIIDKSDFGQLAAELLRCVRV